MKKLLYPLILLRNALAVFLFYLAIALISLYLVIKEFFTENFGSSKKV